jgi:predicted enzyme related to lactoylglutathione lyase
MTVLSSVNIFTRNLDALVAFYAELFDLNEKTELRSPIYRALDAGGAMIGFNAFEAYKLLKLEDFSETSGVKSLLTFEVAGADDVARISQAATQRGGKMIKEPYDTTYGSRQSVLFDPEGNVFRINAF